MLKDLYSCSETADAIIHVLVANVPVHRVPLHPLHHGARARDLEGINEIYDAPLVILKRPLVARSLWQMLSAAVAAALLVIAGHVNVW